MKIPLFRIYHDKSNIKAITGVIDSSLSWATGPNIELFEKELAEYVGRKYALVFNSGTSALHALMIYYGFKEGDEVMVPSFSFIATANAPLFVGATPIFSDIEEETLGLNPYDIITKITPRTKAIIAVHIGGLSCKIEEIRRVANKYNLILIEDACEALGAKVGTFGDSAVFSFCANKIITTGEGGTVVCDSREMYDKLKLIRSHGRPDTQNYFTQNEESDYLQLGYNWRMSNLLAALGRSQLKKIGKIIKLRQRNAKYILDGIGGEFNENNVYQMLIIRSIDRDVLRKYLNENMIGAKVYFKPIHLTKFYRSMGHGEGELPMTEFLSSEVISLPIYPSMTKREMDYLIKTVNKFNENIIFHGNIKTV